MKATLAERLIVYAVHSGEWEIDRDGRVWRLCVRRGDRWSPGTFKLHPCKRRRAERKLPSTGYLIVQLMVGGRRHMCGAHRLVWQFFNGDIPDGLVINHKNGVKDDNRPTNLETVSSSENSKHAYRTGLRDEHGESNPAAKLTDVDVALVRSAYAAGGVTMEQLGATYGVAFQTISKIIRGQRRNRQSGPVSSSDLRHNACDRDLLTGRFLSPTGQFPEVSP